MTAQAAKKASEAPKGVIAPARKITVDDIRARAERVQRVAKDEVDRATRQITSMDQTRMILYAALGVAVVAGVAYYMGSQAGKRRAPKPKPPIVKIEPR
jgi:hypothetical protein